VVNVQYKKNCTAAALGIFFRKYKIYSLNSCKFIVTIQVRNH